EVTAVEIVAVPLCPCTTVTLVGSAESEKSFGTGLETTRSTLAEWVADVAVPVMVTVYVPGVTGAPPSNVRTELFPSAPLAGEKVAVAPQGRPPSDTPRLSALPEVTAVDTVAVPFCPCTTVTLVGLAESEKSFGTALTIKLTVVTCVADAAVPVM